MKHRLAFFRTDGYTYVQDNASDFWEDVMKPSDPSLTELARAGFLCAYMPYKGFHLAVCYP